MGFSLSVVELSTPIGARGRPGLAKGVSTQTSSKKIPSEDHSKVSRGINVETRLDGLGSGHDTGGSSRLASLYGRGPSPPVTTYTSSDSF